MASTDIYLLPGAVLQLLMLLGLIVALIVAIVRRDRLGRAFLLTVIGIAVLLLDGVLGLLFPFSSGLFADVIDVGSPQGYMGMIGVYNIVTSLLMALGLGLLIGAVFIGRSPANPTPPPPPAHSPGAPPL